MIWNSTRLNFHEILFEREKRRQVWLYSRSPRPTMAVGGPARACVADSTREKCPGQSSCHQNIGNDFSGTCRAARGQAD
jgi:hypothetical protein